MDISFVNYFVISKGDILDATSIDLEEIYVFGIVISFRIIKFCKALCLFIVEGLL